MSIDKAVLPKLWKVLKTGGGGSAGAIYPHLLPLLSKFTKDVLGERTIEFYKNFFENLNLGLKARLVLKQGSSRADVTAIATAYYECLRYFVQFQSVDLFESPTTRTEFCVELLNNNVTGVVGFLLSDSAASNGKYVLMQIAALNQRWKQSADTNAVHQTLSETFWREIVCVIEKSLVEPSNDRHINGNLELIADFIQYLRGGSHKPVASKVKFAIENDVANQEDPVASDHVDGATSDKDDILESFILQLTKFYMKRISDSNNVVYVTYLENLLKTFGSLQFYQKLAGGDNIAKLYDKFACWLLISQLRCENIIDIILMLYPHLSVADKSALLRKLINFPNVTAQHWVLSRILSHPLCTEPNVRQLLSQGTVADLLIKSAKDVINGNVTENINLLHKCFFQNESGIF